MKIKMFQSKIVQYVVKRINGSSVTLEWYEIGSLETILQTLTLIRRSIKNQKISNDHNLLQSKPRKL